MLNIYSLSHYLYPLNFISYFHSGWELVMALIKPVYPLSGCLMPLSFWFNTVSCTQFIFLFNIVVLHVLARMANGYFYLVYWAFFLLLK